MMTFFASLQALAVVVGLVLLPMALVMGMLTLRKRFIRNRNRRSPLTSDLFRPPGWGLQERMEELTQDINVDVTNIMWVPLALLATYQIQIQTNEKVHPQILSPLFVLTVVVILVYLTVKLIRRAEERQKYREALAGELATAQLLEPIVANGGRLLHDVQAPGFNIDHVVVAPGGVFAVETKHRLKPTTGTAKEQTRVTFDGKVLHFPGWTETKPVEQARTRARWLSERLTKSTGLAVQARPVVALPGWFVECTAPSDVVVTNPKGHRFMLKPRPNESPLAPDTIQRIAFQLEQLCRIPVPGESQRSSGGHRYKGNLCHGI